MWVSERETVFTVRRWQNGELSELILWFSNAGTINTVRPNLFSLILHTAWPWAWAVDAGCCCGGWLWRYVPVVALNSPCLFLSPTVCSTVTVHSASAWTVWGQFCFLSCSGCWSVWCPGKAWLYNCLWFAATLYSLYRAWGRWTGRYNMLMWGVSSYL